MLHQRVYFVFVFLVFLFFFHGSSLWNCSDFRQYLIIFIFYLPEIWKSYFTAFSFLAMSWYLRMFWLFSLCTDICWNQWIDLVSGPIKYNFETFELFSSRVFPYTIFPRKQKVVLSLVTFIPKENWWKYFRYLIQFK